MNAVDPNFIDVLAPHDLATLDRDANVIFGIWADFRLAYMNPGWFHFAADNEGEPGISIRFPLGTDIRNAWPAELKGFWSDQFKRSLESGEIFEFDYECSAPMTYRLEHMIAYPLKDRAGLLVVNSLVVERPIEEARVTLDESYFGPSGIVTQCVHCRRIKNLVQPKTWDWIPELVAKPDPNTSHALCERCMAHFYDEPA